jgi:PAS domain S-box-containing protein
MSGSGWPRLPGAEAALGFAILPYAFAGGAVVIAVLLTIGIWLFIQPHIYVLFVAAVVLSGCYGGLGPALLATAISAAAIAFFLPRYVFVGASVSELPSLGLFVLIGVLVGALHEAHRRARRSGAEQLESEQAARIEAEAIQRRLRDLIDGLEAIVWERDPRTLRFVFVSERAHQMLGYPVERWLTEEDFWVSLIHEEEREEAVRRCHQSIAEGQDCELEYRARAADGRELWLRDRVHPVRKNGQVRQIGGFTTDVTDRRRLEAERIRLLEREQRARRDAEAASRAKDEFLAAVSHELRTPLTSMLGWARLLRAGNLDAAMTEHALDAIDRNAQLQAGLIEDLLDVSSIVTGRLRLDARSLDMVAVIRAAVEIVRPAAEAKRVVIETSLEPAIGPVSADRDRLRQVLWNLLSNAVKFTPQGGHIHVRTERVASHVEIKVSDTGKGISPELLPHIFEQFRQGDRSSVRSGLGLGLAIVRHLVELHGGTVRAESGGEGRGTTFTVELPITAAGAGSGEREGPRFPDPFTARGGAPALHGVRVLLVDDDADARELLETILTNYGAAVIVAASADEALAAFRGDAPDVVISDIGLPRDDGYVLIRRIRELAPERGGHVPAVALTAYARDEDRGRALAAGFQMHIAKPAEPQELAAVVLSLAQLRKTAG